MKLRGVIVANESRAAAKRSLRSKAKGGDELSMLVLGPKRASAKKKKDDSILTIDWVRISFFK